MTNKPLLTKEGFVNAIMALKRDDNYVDECAKLTINIFEHLEAADVAVRLLETIMNDDGEYISWWMYEKDWGQNDDLNVYDESDNIIELTTPEQLYDFLLENYKPKQTAE